MLDTSASSLPVNHLSTVTAVHPDPLDSFALATYASATGRSSEQMPLQHIEKSRCGISITLTLPCQHCTYANATGYECSQCKCSEKLMLF